MCVVFGGQAEQTVGVSTVGDQQQVRRDTERTERRQSAEEPNTIRADGGVSTV